MFLLLLLMLCNVYADAVVNFTTIAVAVGADAEHTDVECVVIVFCS